MAGNNLNIPPEEDEIEVSLFGPGYGECVVIHLGLGEWVILDSCQGHSEPPAPLKYLHTIGVDPSTAVKFVVASHWHDDHVRGLGTVFDQCESSKLICSVAVNTNEFVTLTDHFGKRSMMTTTSGVTEFRKILQTLEKRIKSPRRESRGPEWTMANNLLWKRANSSLPGVVYALSPSPAAITLAQQQISNYLSKSIGTRTRAVALTPNHLAVVLWVQIGDCNMLFGSDLEETKDPGTGWSVILGLPPHQGCRASLFKVPHHGSKNADQPAVWSSMLASAPFAILTPFCSGKTELPRKSDATRILQRTPYGYLSARTGIRPRNKRIPAVEKTMREVARNIRVVERPVGHIRLRRALRSTTDEWRPELFNGALPLKEL